MRARPSRIQHLILAVGLVASVALATHSALAQEPWAAPPAERARENPLPADKATLELGEQVARTNCAPCHGTSFKGDGPAAPALNPKPADWTSGRVQRQTDGGLFWKISNGRGSMPAWRHLPEKERWAVIRFIRSLGK